MKMPAIGRGRERSEKGLFERSFFRDLTEILIRPTAFYERREQSGPVQAFLFLLPCALFFSLMASLFDGRQKLFFSAVYLINALSMPFITAFAVYAASALLFRGRLPYGSSFGIAAYAQATLVVAWIPGMAWLSGLWTYYLIGAGVMASARVGFGKAFSSILIAACFLLFLVRLCGFLAGP